MPEDTIGVALARTTGHDALFVLSDDKGGIQTSIFIFKGGIQTSIFIFKGGIQISIFIFKGATDAERRTDFFRGARLLIHVAF